MDSLLVWTCDPGCVQFRFHLFLPPAFKNSLQYSVPRGTCTRSVLWRRPQRLGLADFGLMLCDIFSCSDTLCWTGTMSTVSSIYGCCLVLHSAVLTSCYPAQCSWLFWVLVLESSITDGLQCSMEVEEKACILFLLLLFLDCKIFLSCKLSVFVNISTLFSFPPLGRVFYVA